MKQFIVILFLVIVSVQVLAAGSYTDLYHIGKIGTTANTVLEIGDSAEFRFNFSTLKMQYSNNGTNFYDVIGRDDTVTLENKSFDVSSNTLTNVVVTNLAAGVLDTDLSTVSASDDTLGSAKAIKNYVDAEIVANSVPTLAKGGLITHSTVNVAQAVGANGQVLTADSAVTNGIKWSTPSVADHTISSPSVLTQKSIDSLNNTITNINTGDFQAGAIDTDLTSVSASDNTLASAKAIKTYVDASAGGGSTGYWQSTATSFQTTNTSAWALLGFSVTIVSTGKPVIVTLKPSTFSSRIEVLLFSGFNACQFRLIRTLPSSFTVGGSWVGAQGSGSPDPWIVLYSLPSVTFHDLTPPTGNVTYEIEWSSNSSVATCNIRNFHTLVIEL